MIRTYSELERIPTFEARFDYLNLKGAVGATTFGYDRWINQEFYRSAAWKRARIHVIARDYGCDLGLMGHEIFDKVYVHHMNPMSAEDIIHSSIDIINPEYLISVCHTTHNAIHFGDASLLPKEHVDRRPGDTKLW